MKKIIWTICLSIVAANSQALDRKYTPVLPFLSSELRSGSGDIQILNTATAKQILPLGNNPIDPSLGIPFQGTNCSFKANVSVRNPESASGLSIGLSQEFDFSEITQTQVTSVFPNYAGTSLKFSQNTRKADGTLMVLEEIYVIAYKGGVPQVERFIRCTNGIVKQYSQYGDFYCYDHLGTNAQYKAILNAAKSLKVQCWADQ